MAVLRFGDCELDLVRYELRRDGRVVTIEPQVFDVLAHLANRPDEVIAKDDLLDAVWGDRFVSESAVTSRIKSARQAVGDDGQTQGVIRTVHGRGYRFVAEVIEVQSAGAAAVDPRRETPPAGQALRSARFEIETRYLQHGARTTAYQIVGDGDGRRDIVFINGFVSHLELQWEIPGFADFFERLARLGRLIMYDRSGTGLSDRLAVGESSTLEERVEEVIAVLDAAASERVTLVGISEGGALSVLLAAQHPERVRGLVLLNSFANNDHHETATIDWFLGWVERNWGRGSVFTKVLAPSWSDDPTMVQLCARYERHAAPPSAARWNIENTILHTDVAELLDTVQVPALIVHREGDQMVPVQCGELLAEHIPGADFARLPGDDHLVFAGDHDALFAPIEEFLSSEDVMPPSVERSLRAILFTDIVGSTDRATEMGDARWRDLLGRFHRRAEEVAARHGGTVVKNTGDGVLATFGGPASAVRGAIDLRRAMEPLGLSLRSGVHFAEVEIVGHDIAGIGVHIGARVADLADPGEVWVSRTVHDLVAGSGLEFVPRGEHDLRGADRTWELFSAS